MSLNVDVVAADIEKEEGRVRHAYTDTEGFLTIGVGFLIDKRRGGGLRDEEIDFILHNRIGLLKDELDRKMPWWTTLSPERQLVVFQMAYQMGVGNERSGLLSFRNTLRAVREGRYADAARGMRNSLWARQTPKRAARLANIMEGK